VAIVQITVTRCATLRHTRDASNAYIERG